jgi:hypothetical protein
MSPKPQQAKDADWEMKFMEAAGGKKGQEANCQIPVACARKVPGWIVIVDNVPTLGLFILGALILWLLWKPLSLLFLLYCGLSIILFWRLICTCCHHYDSQACPCGYGMMAPKLFKPRKNGDFRKVFKHHIGIMFPCWLVPTIAGGYLLYDDFSKYLLGIFIGFCVISYVAIPAIAKFVGCRGCQIKNECPWMTNSRNIPSH